MSREPSPEIPMLNIPRHSRASPSASRGVSQIRAATYDSSNADSPNSANGAASASLSAKASPDRAPSRSVPKQATPRAGSAGTASEMANGSPASQGRASVSQGRPSTSQPRASAAAAAAAPTTATTTATASAARPSASAASLPRASAAGSVTRASGAAASVPRPAQPSVPRTTPGSTVAPSLPRPTATMGSRASVAPGAAANGGAAAAIKASVMASTMPEGQFTGVSGDIAKYLKDLIRRRDEGVYMRVLPKHQQLQQLLVQEAAARELATQQEQTGRLMVVHKAHEERAKRREQEIARATKERLDALKKYQQEEAATQKAVVTALQAETDKEIRERLRAIQALHPKLNPTSAALADLKNERSDCAVLAALLEEDKKLQKALKGNARHAKSKTAETDGGALPFWFKDCVAASYNVAAILANQPYRASVMDAPSIATKVPAEKKLLVVRATAAADAPIVAWAHTRVAMPDAATAAAALVSFLGASVEDDSHNNAALPIPPVAECGAKAECAQVVWPKEDAVAVTKLAKAPKTQCACLQSHVVNALSYGGVSSHEFMHKDVNALGEAASAAP